MSIHVGHGAHGRRTFARVAALLLLTTVVGACAAGRTPAPSAATLDGNAADVALAAPSASGPTAGGVPVMTGGLSVTAGGVPNAAASGITSTSVAPEGVVSSMPGATAGTGAAIAYPYPYVGSAGVAPDHTIVVTGVGSADVASDGTDRVAAERTALTAALADARAQADTIAAAAHVTVVAVLSVSASVSPFFAYPVGVAEPQTGGSAGSAPSAGGMTPGALPPAIVVPPPGPTQLTASATVAYTIR